MKNHDVPGVIGHVGTVLGSNSINIANFSLGRRDDPSRPGRAARSRRRGLDRRTRARNRPRAIARESRRQAGPLRRIRVGPASWPVPSLARQTALA